MGVEIMTAHNLVIVLFANSGMSVNRIDPSVTLRIGNEARKKAEMA